MGPQATKKAWSRIYAYAGVSSGNEAEKRAIRLALYVYCCLNGTSRAGVYSGSIKTSSGHEFSASVLSRGVGVESIRRFMRANADESYEALKESGVMEKDDRFVAHVAKLGISAENSFATADWLDGCPKMTQAEKAANEAARDRGLERAIRARGGRTLEDVEEIRRGKSMRVQGALSHDGDEADY